MKIINLGGIREGIYLNNAYFCFCCLTFFFAGKH